VNSAKKPGKKPIFYLVFSDHSFPIPFLLSSRHFARQIQGGVFATYNMEENSPSFLNDKNLYFPNLPEGLRSGIIDRSLPGSNMYDMFTSDSVHKYDMYKKEVSSVQPLRDYVRCK
jgi:hypothetical protein